jgi:hypothetical protein
MRRSLGRLGSPAAGEVSGATDDDDAMTAASANMHQTGVALAMMRVSESGPFETAPTTVRYHRGGVPIMQPSG